MGEQLARRPWVMIHWSSLSEIQINYPILLIILTYAELGLVSFNSSDTDRTALDLSAVEPLDRKKTPNDAVTPQHQSQFTTNMKANAVPHLLSSLV